MAPLSREEVLGANVEFHSQLADRFNDTQPYMLSQNKDRVRGILQGLAAAAPRASLLDIGCGTGFIIELALPMFDRIVGVDITPTMLEKVPRNEKVELFLAEAERIPCEASTFGVATAYAVLQHVHAYEPVFRETFRCWAPGGVLYADESQNFYCAEALRSLPACTLKEPLLGE